MGSGMLSFSPRGEVFTATSKLYITAAVSPLIVSKLSGFCTKTLISDSYYTLHYLQLFSPTVTTSDWYMYDRSVIVCDCCRKITIGAGTVLYLSPPVLQTVILSPRRA